MSITRSPFAKQYEHIGNVRHGVQTGPWRVEFDAPVKDEAASYKINQGSVVSLNAEGQFVIGCSSTSGVNCPVPFMSMKNIFDPDVTTGISNANMAEATYSAVGGNITAIPNTCGYELETTEFDATATYYPNDGLKAATGDDIGKITKATVAPGNAEAYLGFVSKAPSKDYFGNKRLAYFANFIPAGIASGKVAGTGVSGIEVTGTGSTITWSFADDTLTATLS